MTVATLYGKFACTAPALFASCFINMSKVVGCFISELSFVWEAVMHKRNAKELKQRMKGYWLSAYKSIAPELKQAIDKLGDNVPCPLAGGTDGFRLFRDANETGGGVKQAEGVFAQGIDLLMWLKGWTFTEVLDELEAFLGGKPVKSSFIKTPLSTSKNDEASLRKWLNTVWKNSFSFTDSKSAPARAYFYNRGMLDAALCSRSLRFNPSLAYRDSSGNLIGLYPAIIALIRNNLGVPVGLSRTYITEQGFKVELGQGLKAKKMTPSVLKRSKGRHVHLAKPKDGYLGVAEGIETALAVYQGTKFPTWPTMSSTMLEAFSPPREVHTLLIFADKDRSGVGERSAHALCSSLAWRGIRTLVLTPPIPILSTDEKGIDWADQLVRDVTGFDLISNELMKLQAQSA